MAVAPQLKSSKSELRTSGSKLKLLPFSLSPLLGSWNRTNKSSAALSLSHCGELREALMRE
jgi:hypothetical protein